MGLFRHTNKNIMNDFLLKVNDSVRERFLKLERRVRKNEYISSFYESLWQSWIDDYALHYDVDSVTASEDLIGSLCAFPYEKHVYKSEFQVKNCSRWFQTEYYPLQSVKDLTRTYTCNNKFCEGCQSVLAQQRYEKFSPFLEALSTQHYIAHVVLTVPNCDFTDLKLVLDNMYNQKKFLIRYLKGDARVKGIDFSKYGYQGAVMALEITKSERDGKAHPHFHCIMVFEKNKYVFGRRVYTNSYSFNNEDRKKLHRKKNLFEPDVRLFNAFEILLQKVWYLRINHIEVNKENIDNLKEGYSCIVERAEEFHEVFKYATKGVIKWSDDKDNILSCYSDFIYSDMALYRRRMIQAYGCLRKIPIPDEVDQSSDNDKLYEELCAKLRAMESPIEQRELLDSLLEEQKTYKHIKYISRKNFLALIGGDDDKT